MFLYEFSDPKKISEGIDFIKKHKEIIRVVIKSHLNAQSINIIAALKYEHPVKQLHLDLNNMTEQQALGIVTQVKESPVFIAIQISFSKRKQYNIFSPIFAVLKNEYGRKINYELINNDSNDKKRKNKWELKEKSFISKKSKQDKNSDFSIFDSLVAAATKELSSSSVNSESLSASVASISSDSDDEDFLYNATEIGLINQVYPQQPMTKIPAFETLCKEFNFFSNFEELPQSISNNQLSPRM